MVILPGALASAFTMAVTGRMRGRLDSRWLVLAGVAVFTVAMVQMSHFTTESGRADFVWPLILRGVGLGLVFVPLTNLALADLPMARIPEGTGLFNLMRQLGGSVGIALAATQLPRLETLNRAALAANVTSFDPATRERLTGIARSLVAHGTPSALADGKALAVLNVQVGRQALMLSFEQMFLMFSVAFLVALPLLLLMSKGRGVQGAAAH